LKVALNDDKATVTVAFNYTGKAGEALGVDLSAIADGLPEKAAESDLVPAHLCVITLTLRIPIDKFDELRGPVELLAELKKRFGLSAEFAVNGVSEGSTRVEFIGTEEDWSALTAVFGSGGLEELGVQTLTRESPPGSGHVPMTLAEIADREFRWPWQRWRHRRRFRRTILAQSAAAQANTSPWNEPGYWERYRTCRALALLGIVCSWSGVLPFDARFGYTLGVALAGAAFLLGRWMRRRKLRLRTNLMTLGMTDPGDTYNRGPGEVIPGLVARINDGLRWPGHRLPLIAVALNLIAMFCWPWCIGFERTPTGYRFGIVNRAPFPPNPQP
jgi:hypothetical protein